jgi:hypothetical protein
MGLVNLQTNTSPVLLHGPKAASPAWPAISQYFMQHPPQQLMPEDLTVWMCGGPETPDPIFAQSMRLCGLPARIAGLEWAGRWSNYRKLKLNFEACKAADTPYVMCCDSLDVVVCGELQRAVDYLQETGAKMLFNGEPKFFPDYKGVPTLMDAKRVQRVTGGAYPYLNAGIWIAEREYAQAFFDICQDVYPEDIFDCTDFPNLRREGKGCDQSIIHHWSRLMPEEVRVDSNAVVFQNLAHIQPSHVRIQPSII